MTTRSPQDVLDKYGFYVLAADFRVPVIGEVVDMGSISSSVLPTGSKLVITGSATEEEFKRQVQFLIGGPPLDYGLSYWKAVAE